MLRAFDRVQGVLYFVKDRQSRLMAISPGSLERMGFRSEEEVLGKTVDEYLPPDLAAKYLRDDQWVMEHDRPLLNVVEMWFNEQGFRDWIVTDKHPLHDASGQVVGLMGLVQSFEARRKAMSHLGPVGRAADFIRDHLPEPMMLADIARHAGLSERQLQRLFRRVFGLTLQQFIIQSRVQAAIHELTRSGKTIAEVASQFGFSDQSAFTNSFRKVTGLPPGAYRERFFAKSVSIGTNP